MSVDHPLLGLEEVRGLDVAAEDGLGVELQVGPATGVGAYRDPHQRSLDDRFLHLAHALGDVVALQITLTLAQQVHLDNFFKNFIFGCPC